MAFIRNLISSIVGGSTGKVDALHYFVTKSSAGDKKKILKVIVHRVNKEQKAVVDRGRKSLSVNG